MPWKTISKSCRTKRSKFHSSESFCFVWFYNWFRMIIFAHEAAYNLVLIFVFALFTRATPLLYVDGLCKLFVNCWCWTQNLIPSLKIFRRHSRQCFTSPEKNSNFLSRIYRSQARIKFWGQKFELSKRWSRQLSQSGFDLSRSKRSFKPAAHCHTFLPSQSISFFLQLTFLLYTPKLKFIEFKYVL